MSAAYSSGRFYIPENIIEHYNEIHKTKNEIHLFEFTIFIATKYKCALRYNSST